MIDKNNTFIKGYVKIYDVGTGEILLDKTNAIHYENMSEALSLSLANKGTGYIEKMAFGNGATAVDSTGVITYLPTNTFGQNASLYNQTYEKIVDNTSALNSDPSKNFIEVRHTPGVIFTDIYVSCLLNYTEPSGQQAFDNSATMSGTYVFDELGLLSESGRLLTHVIFHPIQKSLNRLIQIDYTVRIQTLTNLSTNL
jgi:hypothetical protein